MTRARVLLLALGAGCSDLSVYKWADTAAPTDDTDAVAPPAPPRKPDTPDTPADTDPPVDTSPPADTSVAPGEPVADAGADVQTVPLRTVRLDGRASYDPQGLTPLTYRWRVTRRPPGSTTLLLTPAVARPSLWIDLAGTYEARLEVRNRAGVWDSTPDTVQILSVPDQELYLQLSWDAASDLDLHVLRPGVDLFADQTPSVPGDCNYCQKNPAWPPTGPDDNPSLDWDVIDGFGPETTTVRHPSPGQLEAKVHYYGVGGTPGCGGSCPASVATLRVYVQGQLVDTLSHTLDRAGQVWHAVTVDWPSATVTHVDTVDSTSLTGCR